MEEKIIDIINNIKPYLNMEGGDIDFVKFEDGYVYIKLSGTCQNCEYQDVTLYDGIENMIKEELPDIKGVINVLI